MNRYCKSVLQICNLSVRARLIMLSLLTIILAVNTSAMAQTEFLNTKFVFGAKKQTKDCIPVSSTSRYSVDTGFGFDFDSKPDLEAIDNKGKIGSAYATSSSSFFFSVNMVPGNYEVILYLGNRAGTSTTTVKAESRRLMLEKFKTSYGQIKKARFIINVRRPQILSGGTISLTRHEPFKLDWDNKLTLEFTGSCVCVDAIMIKPVKNQITVYLAGNSTVVDQDFEPWAAWGQMIPKFFKSGVAISDQAQSGLTAGTFIAERRLEKILSEIKPGDYLLIEFGHNDQREKGPGDGPFGSYTERLKVFINKTRQEGAIPVIVTSTARRSFRNGRIVNTLGDYPNAAREVAQKEHCALIDLNQMSSVLFQTIGEEKSKKAFVHYPAGTFPGQDKELADDTHFNSYGAYELARCVLKGIEDANLKLAKYIIDDGKFDPSKPDPISNFDLPQSPRISLEKPEGN